MNVAEVRELFSYNAWANRRMFGALAELPVEQYQRDVKCSFGSIHGTIAHIVGAEQLWLARWRGRQPGSVLKGSDVGSLAELRTIWEGVEADRALGRQRVRAHAAADGATCRGPFLVSSRSARHPAAPARREASQHGTDRVLSGPSRALVSQSVVV